MLSRQLILWTRSPQVPIGDVPVEDVTFHVRPSHSLLHGAINTALTRVSSASLCLFVSCGACLLFFLIPRSGLF